jgi:hypothetical protein
MKIQKKKTKSFTNIFYEPIINFLFSIISVRPQSGTSASASRPGRGVGSRHGQGGGRDIVFGSFFLKSYQSVK